MRDLTEFADFVTEGRSILQRRNADTWLLGDLAVHFEVKLGRPTDPDAPTLSDLASAWDVETPRASEWRNVAKFYPLNVRTFELSWSHYNLARRAAAGDLDNALELLTTAQRLHMGVRAFKRYLGGIYWEGPLDREDLPPQVECCLPSGVREVWVTVKQNGVNE